MEMTFLLFGLGTCLTSGTAAAALIVLNWRFLDARLAGPSYPASPATAWNVFYGIAVPTTVAFGNLAAALYVLRPRIGVLDAHALLAAIIVGLALPLTVEHLAVRFWPAASITARTATLMDRMMGATKRAPVKRRVGAWLRLLSHVSETDQLMADGPSRRYVVRLDRTTLGAATLLPAAVLVVVLQASAALPTSILRGDLAIGAIAAGCCLAYALTLSRFPRKLLPVAAPHVVDVSYDLAASTWRRRGEPRSAKPGSRAHPAQTAAAGEARRLALAALVLGGAVVVPFLAPFADPHAEAAMLIAAAGLPVISGLLALITMATHTTYLISEARTEGFLLGAPLPLHFLRQASHRLNNALLPAQATLDRAGRLLDRLSQAEPSGPAMSGDRSVSPGDKREIAFVRGRLRGAERGVGQALEWLDRLKTDAQSTTETFASVFAGEREEELPLHDLVVETLDILTNQQDVRRYPDGSQVVCELTAVVDRTPWPILGEVGQSADDAASRAATVFEGYRIRVPAGLMKDVLANLVRNATDALLQDERAARRRASETRALRSIESMPERDGRADADWMPTVSVTFAVDRTSYYPVTIAVRDNGPGIPASIKPQIGQPYFSSKGLSGNGVGVFTARTALQLLGGSLTFSTSSDAQATSTEFLVSLPYDRCDLSGRDRSSEPQAGDDA